VASENQTETVLADFDNIQQRFIRENRRFVKSDVLEKFVNDETLSQEARDLTAEAVEGMYENVVWDDDVFGNHVVSILDLVKLRYRKAHS
jgi:hypothetical protein